MHRHACVFRRQFQRRQHARGRILRHRRRLVAPDVARLVDGHGVGERAADIGRHMKPCHLELLPHRVPLSPVATSFSLVASLLSNRSIVLRIWQPARCCAVSASPRVIASAIDACSSIAWIARSLPIITQGEKICDVIRTIGNWPVRN